MAIMKKTNLFGYFKENQPFWLLSRILTVLACGYKNEKQLFWLLQKTILLAIIKNTYLSG